jgi:hypothetical protein
MLRDGRYSVWFKTAEADGVGIIDLADGQVSGRDTVIEYSGRLVQDGDRFKASVSTRRHSPGHAGILGLDEFDVDFEGTSGSRTAACNGTVRQLPDVPLEVVLLLMEG